VRDRVALVDREALMLERRHTREWVALRPLGLAMRAADGGSLSAGGPLTH
jgi:hypothetical protein